VEVWRLPAKEFLSTWIFPTACSETKISILCVLSFENVYFATVPKRI